jgi:hypothetical protein
MKTRVTTISNLVLSLTFCLGLASCNKEDFYQKDFLNNSVQNPTTTGSVDNGGQAGVDSGSVGGTQGGVDTGVNGGTTGSTTGSSSTTGGTAGGVDGSTTAGSTTGSTTSGTTGSTTVGSTTGSTTSGSTTGSTTSGTTTGSTTVGSTTGSTTSGTTTGSTTSGSTTGSTTSGSTTGSTTSGSTTGSTVGGTTGGSTTGSSTGGTTGGTTGVVYQSQTETFHQAAAQTKKLDILWIVDDSGSMDDEQASLGTNFSAFIDDFITKDVDFKMAITTTDTSSANKKGRMVTTSDTKLTSAKAKANEAQFKADFKSLVKVGVAGSGYEKGLEASEGFMSRYAASFLRQDAYLAVVIISDEEDQSSKTVAQYTDYLKTFKNEAGLVKVYSIVDSNLTNNGSGITTGYQRYAQASTNTAGKVADIRDDFYRSLSDMGDSIINLLDSFALANNPVAGSMKVYINGIETTFYSYDAASRSIKFDLGHLPPVGAEVKVTYLK